MNIEYLRAHAAGDVLHLSQGVKGMKVKFVFEDGREAYPGANDEVHVVDEDEDFFRVPDDGTGRIFAGRGRLWVRRVHEDRYAAHREFVEYTHPLWYIKLVEDF